MLYFVGYFYVEYNPKASYVMEGDPPSLERRINALFDKEIAEQVHNDGIDLVSPYYANMAANAIEYNLVFDVSPRELSTQGTLAPMSMAPTSLLSNLVQHL